MKFEYRVEKFSEYELAKRLNELGGEGWQLVSRSEYNQYIFMRSAVEFKIDREFWETSSTTAQQASKIIKEIADGINTP